MNILLPVLAILIPYKFYDENSLKKILASGVIVIILLSLSMSAYQLGFIYDQPSQNLRSENLEQGSVEPLYGNPNTNFNFTVNVTEEFIQEWDSENYTVYVNLTLSTVGGIGEKDYDGYKMKPVNSSERPREYYRNLDLEERLFGHYFSIRKNMTEKLDEMENETEGVQYSWETSSSGYGPITIQKMRAFQYLAFEYVFSTTLIYLLGMGLLWWKNRMDRSVSESTEGLEEKEEELEEYCPECGTLLEGADECEECGWEKEPEEDESTESDEDAAKDDDT
ncbi:MAG: hypothetical protein KGY76_06595 [Candidatus Thermoplasmatota archaeon]|nr:hypothetical protein [Candidatus Thermoplasmatota archaeon]